MGGRHFHTAEFLPALRFNKASCLSGGDLWDECVRSTGTWGDSARTSLRGDGGASLSVSLRFRLSISLCYCISFSVSLTLPRSTVTMERYRPSLRASSSASATCAVEWRSNSRKKQRSNSGQAVEWSATCSQPALSRLALTHHSLTHYLSLSVSLCLSLVRKK